MSSSTALERALILCLIEDQHVVCDDWTEWAIAELMRCEDAPGWLSELGTTRSIEDALALLRSRRRSPTVQDRIGSLWLAFSANEVTSTELLELALEAAGGWDTGGGFIPYQHELMALLRRVEQLGTPAGRGTLEEIERDAVALLAPLGEQVRKRVAGRITMTGLQAKSE